MSSGVSIFDVAVEGMITAPPYRLLSEEYPVLPFAGEDYLPARDPGRFA